MAAWGTFYKYYMTGNIGFRVISAFTRLAHTKILHLCTPRDSEGWPSVFWFHCDLISFNRGFSPFKGSRFVHGQGIWKVGEFRWRRRLDWWVDCIRVCILTTTVSSKSIGTVHFLLLFWLCTQALWIWNDTIIMRLKCRLSALISEYFNPLQHFLYIVPQF
jgi:hypothetical protein